MQATAAAYLPSAALALSLLLSPALAEPCDVQESLGLRLHYAPNGNFDNHGHYLPGKAGFSLADVNSLDQLESLNADVKAMVWIGRCDGADEDFRNIVQPHVGNPKVFGFFLRDDSDPRGMFESGRLPAPCTPDKLKAESDWVHGRMPGAKTFIVLMNLSTSATLSFEHSDNRSINPLATATGRTVTAASICCQRPSRRVGCSAAG